MSVNSLCISEMRLVFIYYIVLPAGVWLPYDESLVPGGSAKSYAMSTLQSALVQFCLLWWLIFVWLCLPPLSIARYSYHWCVVADLGLAVFRGFLRFNPAAGNEIYHYFLGGNYLFWQPALSFWKVQPIRFCDGMGREKRTRELKKISPRGPQKRPPLLIPFFFLVANLGVSCAP